MVVYFAEAGGLEHTPYGVTRSQNMKPKRLPRACRVAAARDRIASRHAADCVRHWSKHTSGGHAMMPCSPRPLQPPLRGTIGCAVPPSGPCRCEAAPRMARMPLARRPSGAAAAIGGLCARRSSAAWRCRNRRRTARRG